MVFSKVDSTAPVITYLTDLLISKLADGSVLWLVPGGSAIMVAVAVAQNLAAADLSRLTVTLTDERYGPVGHADSNWQQLTAAGFKLSGAQVVPILHGHDIDQTTTEFAQHLQEYSQGATYCVGLLGIGSDGHTAGILPDSPATTSANLASSYQGSDFKRITITPPALAALNEVVVYARGEAKKQALLNLQTDLPVAQQPAHALKQVAKLTIFNDQIGDTV